MTGQSERRACPFCDYQGPSPVVRRWSDDGQLVLVFKPLNPVVAGHLLVVPERHVESAADSPKLAGSVMQIACAEARTIGDCNIITSIGKAATQTVRHLHIHVVPRRKGDGLRLPWSPS